MKSSYKENNYQEVFAAIIAAFCPLRCVELGVLHGYSTFAIGAALKRLGRGELHAFDLFDDYEFNHSREEDVRMMFNKCDNVHIFKHDAFTVHDRYEDRCVDLLHVDLSNSGDTVKMIMERWDRKMVHGGIILFEGGTEERDNVEWMTKYAKPPIKPELETNQIIADNYIFGTYLKFPGLTMLLKKR